MSDDNKTDVEAHLAHLRDCVWDLPGELLYYDRKRDEEGPTPEEVRALQRDGHLTIEMLTQWFAEALKKEWPK